MSQPIQNITLRYVGDEAITTERLSTTAITPGHLVEESSGAVAVHSTAAANASKLFAQPKLTTSGDIDTAYVSGEGVRYAAYSAGDEVNALVAAGAPAIVDGDNVESAGDGTLRKVLTDAATDDTQRNSIVGTAIVDLDNSAGGAPARLAIRVA